MDMSPPSGWVTPQGPKITATHTGLDFVSTGHQAKISHVPFCALPARRQRPVLTPAGKGQGKCRNLPPPTPPLHPRPHSCKEGQGQCRNLEPPTPPSVPQASPFPATTGFPGGQSLSSWHRASGMRSLCQERKGARRRGPFAEPGPIPGVRTGAPPLPGRARPLRAPAHTPARARGGEEKPLLQERGGPQALLAALPPLPALHTKPHLSTGVLPLVGGHDQVGDDEEDVLSLKNQRGVEEPPPQGGLAARGGEGVSAWVIQTLGATKSGASTH